MTEIKKRLQELIDPLKAEEIIGSLDIDIEDICINSSLAKEGSLFIASKGFRVDGHAYIEDAILKGAIAIVCTSIPIIINKSVTYIKVADTNKIAGKLAQKFFENSSHQFTLIGITGTNGKTSIAYILYHLLTKMNYKVGLFSTIDIKIGLETRETQLTTPNPIFINRIMYEMALAECEFVIMEVSSHAIDQHRISGLEFDIAVFTNLTHDHISYHGGFDNYRDTKKSWFDSFDSNITSIINIDDKNGKYMVQSSKSKVKYYGLRTLADYKVKIVESNMDGLQLQINGIAFISRLRGTFNAYNICAAFGVAAELGLNNMDIAKGLSAVNTIPGRFEVIQDEKKSIWGVIDYAHTPDALDKILSNVKKIIRGQGRLITVVGCGGDRDKEKRSLMAKVAVKRSDILILTSDNPRSEHPDDIIREMMSGLIKEEKNNVERIVDRKEAIRTAVEMARDKDVIVIAGKGHEKYQEIKGKKYPFDDMVIMKKAFQL